MILRSERRSNNSLLGWRHDITRLSWLGSTSSGNPGPLRLAKAERPGSTRAVPVVGGLVFGGSDSDVIESGAADAGAVDVGAADAGDTESAFAAGAAGAVDWGRWCAGSAHQRVSPQRQPRRQTTSAKDRGNLNEDMRRSMTKRFHGEDDCRRRDSVYGQRL